MAEHRLSLAVNEQESLLHQKLITFRNEDRAGAGQQNGRQMTAGSVAIVGLGYVGLPTAVALHGAADQSAPLIEQTMKSIALRPERVIQRAAEVLVADGRRLAGADWDLAVAHTLRPRTDCSWAYSCPRVLDGTYQFFGPAHLAVV